MKTIPLTQREVALVDDDLFPYLNMEKWHVFRCRSGVNYAALHRNHAVIFMHNVVADCLPGFRPDHKDGNGLNNQISNLRQCTTSQNNANTRLYKNNRTRMKGVTADKYGKFMSRLRLNGKSIYLGYFSDKTDAARAYDAAAVKHFGEFARTNKMMGLIS